jgi:hypothetical protein
MNRGGFLPLPSMLLLRFDFDFLNKLSKTARPRLSPELTG